MSHMTLEYSGNLRHGGAFTDLCRKLAQVHDGAGSGRLCGVSARRRAGARHSLRRILHCRRHLERRGIRSRRLKIGAGRSDAVKQAVCTGLFDIMKAHFADAYANRGLALSLELNEFGEAGTLKHNNLHARFRKT